jgi:hypothetical protein
MAALHVPARHRACPRADRVFHYQLALDCDGEHAVQDRYLQCETATSRGEFLFQNLGETLHLKLFNRWPIHRWQFAYTGSFQKVFEGANRLVISLASGLGHPSEQDPLMHLCGECGFQILPGWN